MIPLQLSVIHQIAQVCHEANRAWCVVTGDDSQRSWENAEPWQQQSAIDGVLFVLAHPTALDSATHDAWCAAKVRDGWTPGPVKDPLTKTHPCLIPFSQLPVAQQAKDRLFKAIVLALGHVTV